MMQMLIDLGEDPHQASSSGMSPIHFTARAGHANATKMLIEECGVDPNLRSSLEGLTPLHYAARGGHMRVANVLIQNGALVGALDDSGNSPQNMWPQKDAADWNEMITELWTSVHGR